MTTYPEFQMIDCINAQWLSCICCCWLGTFCWQIQTTVLILPLTCSCMPLLNMNVIRLSISRSILLIAATIGLLLLFLYHGVLFAREHYWAMQREALKAKG